VISIITQRGSEKDRIEDRLGEDVGRGWYAAWFLHVEGFHDRRLSKEDITWGFKQVKKLVEFIDYE